THQGGERHRVVDAGTDVRHPDLERRIHRVRPHAPVVASRVADRARREEQLEERAILPLRIEARRDPRVRPAPPQNHPVGGVPGVLALVERRARRESDQVRSIVANHVLEANAVEPGRDPDVDVHAEVVLVTGYATVMLGDCPVPLLLGQAMRLPAAERVHARRGDLEADGRRRRRHLEPQAPKLAFERRRRRADPAPDLQRRLLEFGPDLGAPIGGEDFTGSATEGTGFGVDELVLFLDADSKLVFHAAARVLRFHVLATIYRDLPTLPRPVRSKEKAATPPQAASTTATRSGTTPRRSTPSPPHSADTARSS